MKNWAKHVTPNACGSAPKKRHLSYFDMFVAQMEAHESEWASLKKTLKKKCKGGLKKHGKIGDALEMTLFLNDTPKHGLQSFRTRQNEWKHGETHKPKRTRYPDYLCMCRISQPSLHVWDFPTFFSCVESSDHVQNLWTVFAGSGFPDQLCTCRIF